jgi:hypothetical protein
MILQTLIFIYLNVCLCFPFYASEQLAETELATIVHSTFVCGSDFFTLESYN